MLHSRFADQGEGRAIPLILLGPLSLCFGMVSAGDKGMASNTQPDYKGTASEPAVSASNQPEALPVRPTKTVAPPADFGQVLRVMLAE